MLRKFALGLIACAAIATAALSPTAASAHPLGWDWGLGDTYNGTLGGPTAVTTAPQACNQKTPVAAHHHIRFRSVNVCVF